MAIGKTARIAAAVLSAAAAATIYFTIDPAESVWMPKCPFHHLTGLECAGCGSQRAIHAMLHGEFLRAWHSNPLLVILLPYLLALAYDETCGRKTRRLSAMLHHPAAIYIVIALIVGWTVVRNLLY